MPKTSVNEWRANMMAKKALCYYNDGQNKGKTLGVFSCIGQFRDFGRYVIS